MRRFAGWLPVCTLTILCFAGAGVGCNAPDPPARVEAQSQHTRQESRAVPPEIAAVATAALGSGARVLSFGDLAHSGRQQVLAANGAPATSNTEHGIRFTRAAVLEQAGAKWVEVLRCDEYLKNPSGFLIGTPRQPVSSWRLEFGGNTRDHSQDFLFTPLEASGAVSRPMSTVSVRWNPSAKRYQSIDPQSGHFLEEAPSLETPVSPLR